MTSFPQPLQQPNTEVWSIHSPVKQTQEDEAEAKRHRQSTGLYVENI